MKARWLKTHRRVTPKGRPAEKDWEKAAEYAAQTLKEVDEMLNELLREKLQIMLATRKLSSFCREHNIVKWKSNLSQFARGEHESITLDRAEKLINLLELKVVVKD